MGGTKICHFFIVSDSETVEAKVWKEVKRRLLALVEYSGTMRIEDSVYCNLTSISISKEEGAHYYQTIFFHYVGQNNMEHLFLLL